MFRGNKEGRKAARKYRQHIDSLVSIEVKKFCTNNNISPEELRAYESAVRKVIEEKMEE